MKEETTYEQAMIQLEQLAAQMEKGELGIDALAEKLKDAQRLIRFCRSKLTRVEKEIDEILDEKSE